jgi:hypothetical protein
MLNPFTPVNEEQPAMRYEPTALPSLANLLRPTALLSRADQSKNLLTIHARVNSAPTPGSGRCEDAEKGSKNNQGQNDEERDDSDESLVAHDHSRLSWPIALLLCLQLSQFTKIGEIAYGLRSQADQPQPAESRRNSCLQERA